ncbi:MAG: AraC family transcriptional regulator [Huintestinicola sp.]
MENSFKHTLKTNTAHTPPLNVLYAGHQKCEPLHSWGKGVRDHYILHIIASGQGTYSTPDQTYTLSAGDCFLIYPFTEVEYTADEVCPWEYYWINFSGEGAEDILKKTDFSSDSPVMHGCGEDILTNMEKIMDSNNIELAGRLYILLGQLMDKSVRQSESSVDISSEKLCLKKARSFISCSYPLQIGVEDIAAAADVSRTTLFRIFKKCCGMSPLEYLIFCRMEQAKRLLSGTDISVTAVARSVGYEDNLYFSRAFSRYAGISPTEFRRRR